MLDMVAIDLDMEDTVLDMDVPSMVKHLIYANKRSKVLFLNFSSLNRGRNLTYHVLIFNKHDFKYLCFQDALTFFINLVPLSQA